MILFRGLSGVAASFCLPSAVSIITASFTGRNRDMAFAFMGGGQPAGFILGLVLGGVLTDLGSWRSGFYISAGVTAFTLMLTLWSLPAGRGASEPTWKQKWSRTACEIDWTGAIISSTFLGSLSYVLMLV